MNIHHWLFFLLVYASLPGMGRRVTACPASNARARSEALALSRRLQTTGNAHFPEIVRLNFGQFKPQ